MAAILSWPQCVNVEEMPAFVIHYLSAVVFDLRVHEVAMGFWHD